MPIRYRFLLPAAAALVTLGLVTATLATRAFSRVMQRQLAAAHLAHIDSIRREVELTAAQAMQTAALIASSPPVLAAYRAALAGHPDDEADPQVQEARQQLRVDLAPLVAAAEAVTGPGSLRIHLHLPNNRSFLRQWQPGQVLREGGWVDISDDLAGFRRTVAEVNRTGRPVGGIELGRGGFTIRGVVPVRDAEGRQLGSVEVLRPLGEMLGAHLKRPGTHFALLMDTGFLEITTELADPALYPLLEPPFRPAVVVMAEQREVMARVMDPELVEQGRAGVAHAWREPFYTSAFPVHDAFGQLVGVVWMATDESQVLHAQQWFRRRLAVLTAALVAGLALLLVVVGHYAHAPVRATTARLADIAEGAGDLTVRLAVHGRNEMSELGRQFNRFVERLQSSLTALTHTTARLQQRIAALPVEGAPPESPPPPTTVRSIADAVAQTEAILASVESSLAAVRRAEEAQRLLAAVVRSSGDAIMALDREGVILSWNDGAAALYGYAAEAVVGTSYRTLLPHPAGEEAEEVLAAVRRGEPLRRSETRRRRSDGSCLTVSLVISPLRDAQGQVTGASVIERDISQLKEAERAAEAQRKQLVQADRLAALGTLVAGVAHEISNPTAAIAVNAPVVRELWLRIAPQVDALEAEQGPLLPGPLPWEVVREQVPTLLQDIADAAARIESIVRNLKQFARRDSAELNEAVDVNQVVRAALALTRNRVQKATLDLAVELAEGLPRVRGNSQRLEQVVVNLLLNACDALARPEQGIRVATGRDNGGRVTITVADRGVGIPPEHLERIRDPFFTTKRDSGGTGLGLSISTGIVEDHGGELALTSEVGVGTVATVHLPPLEERCG